MLVGGQTGPVLFSSNLTDTWTQYTVALATPPLINATTAGASVVVELGFLVLSAGGSVFIDQVRLNCNGVSRQHALLNSLPQQAGRQSSQQHPTQPAN